MKTSPFSGDRQPERRRGRARKVTRREIEAAKERLRDAAASGDIRACAALVALDEGRVVSIA